MADVNDQPAAIIGVLCERIERAGDGIADHNERVRTIIQASFDVEFIEQAAARLAPIWQVPYPVAYVTCQTAQWRANEIVASRCLTDSPHLTAPTCWGIESMLDLGVSMESISRLIGMTAANLYRTLAKLRAETGGPSDGRSAPRPPAQYHIRFAS